MESPSIIEESRTEWDSNCSHTCSEVRSGEDGITGFWLYEGVGRMEGREEGYTGGGL